MRIALAQLNPIVGDVAGNALLVKRAIEEARAQGAQLLVTSELVLIGYPPRDLLQREGIVEACEVAVRDIAHAAGEMWVIVGHPRRCSGGVRPFRNSASILNRGKIVAICDKQLLPGYDVFDEDRYFEPGGRSCVVEMLDRRVGVVICEDLWRAKDVTAERGYLVEPVAEIAAQRCDIIVSLNASPFVIGKWRKHLTQLVEIAADCRVPIVAVNQVGANDDLVFDGRSLIVARDGSMLAALPGFESAVEVIDLGRIGAGLGQSPPDVEARAWDAAEREVYHALVLGLRDYCRKTNHGDVWLGLSGGIDSALTAVLASAAIGAEHVRGVMMPSRYSSRDSFEDAQEVARTLGMAAPAVMPITALHKEMAEALDAALGPDFCGVADENVQARLRGILLMAMSNARGGLVLATSNKSELAMGYSTLYGDMCGAIAPLGDLTKTRIYALARWINAHHAALGFNEPPIPERSISKAPSAELRPNQTDQDTLPPYALLDQIIERYIELEQSADRIIAETGFDEALVRQVARSIDLAEFKRNQAPVILKVTGRAFGRGRPMPIVMKGGVRLQATGDRERIRDQGLGVRG